MSEKSTRAMRVIPEPAASASVLVAGCKGPVVKSFGPLSYTCGQCGITLLKDVEFKQVQNAIVKCGGCGAFNDISPQHHGH